MHRGKAEAIHGHFTHPGLSVSAPVLRDQVEHSSAGFALELEGLQVLEAGSKGRWAGRVAKSHSDFLAGKLIDMVPHLADQRDGVSVNWVIKEGEDDTKGFFRDGINGTSFFGSHSRRRQAASKKKKQREEDGEDEVYLTEAIATEMKVKTTVCFPAAIAMRSRFKMQDEDEDEMKTTTP